MLTSAPGYIPDVEFDRGRLQALLTRLQWLEDDAGGEWRPESTGRASNCSRGLPKEDAHGQPDEGGPVHQRTKIRRSTCSGILVELPRFPQYQCPQFQ